MSNQSSAKSAFYKCSCVSVTLGYCSIGRGAAVSVRHTGVRQSDWKRRCLGGSHRTHIAPLLLLLLSCRQAARDMPLVTLIVAFLGFLLLKPTLLPLWYLTSWHFPVWPIMVCLPCTFSFCSVIKHQVSRFKLHSVTQNAVSAIVIGQDSMPTPS